MTHWNHRVIVKHENAGTGYDETTKGIYEVFYDDNGDIEMWSEHPSALLIYEGETFTMMLERFETAVGKIWLEEYMCDGDGIFNLREYKQ